MEISWRIASAPDDRWTKILMEWSPAELNKRERKANEKKWEDDFKMIYEG